MFGERPINNLTYYSWDANASMSKLIGRHTVKFGASYRKIGAENFNPSQSRRTLLLRRPVHERRLR